MPLVVAHPSRRGVCVADFLQGESLATEPPFTTLEDLSEAWQEHFAEAQRGAVLALLQEDTDVWSGRVAPAVRLGLVAFVDLR